MHAVLARGDMTGSTGELGGSPGDVYNQPTPGKADTDDDRTGIDRGQRLELYYWMRLTRTFDERMVALWKLGRGVGGTFSQRGHEAISVGAGSRWGRMTSSRRCTATWARSWCAASPRGASLPTCWAAPPASPAAGMSISTAWAT